MLPPLADQNALINGHRIAYGIYGDPEGTPIVLVHGTPSSSLIFRNILPPLLLAGSYKIHLYDLLGYGVSERPASPNVDTSISGQVPILEDLLKFWGLVSPDTKTETGHEYRTFHLIAHDIGGGVAQRFAILSPFKDMLRSITMIDVVSFDSYPSARTREMLKEGLEARMRAADEEHRAHYREWLMSAVSDTRAFEKKAEDREATRGPHEDSGEGALETYLEYISGSVGQPSLFQHQIRHYDPKHTMEVAGRYADIGRWPVKLIWGKEDEWQVISWGQKLESAIPGATLTVVEGAGHFSLEDRPVEIARIIISHVAQS